MWFFAPSEPQSSMAIAVLTFPSTKSCVGLFGHASGGVGSMYYLISLDITELYARTIEFNLNGVSGNWFVTLHSILSWPCIDTINILFHRRTEVITYIDSCSIRQFLPRIRELNVVDCGFSVLEFCFPEFIVLVFFTLIGCPARTFEESTIPYAVSDTPIEWLIMSTEVVL